MGKVYLIKSDNDGYITYKIGKTNRNVKNRIDEMQTGNPGKLSLVFEYDTPNYNKLESTLHNFYKYLNIQGEWFSEELNEEKFITDCEFHDDLINTMKNSGNPFI